MLALLLPTGFAPPLVYWNAALLLAGGYTLFRIAQGLRIGIPTGSLPLFLCGCTGIAALQLATGHTSSPYLTLNQLQFWWGSLLLLPVLRDGLANGFREAPSHWMPPATLLALFTVCLITGMHTVFGPSRELLQPLWWPFLYRNHLAGLLLLCLPLLLWHCVERTRYAMLAAAAAVLGVAAVVASGSRAGTVLLMTEMGILGACLLRRASRSRRWMLVALGIAGVLLALALGGTAVLQHRATASVPLLEGRIDYWRASVHMIAERPLTGWGFGTWPDVYRQFQDRDSGLVVNQAHSDWLEWSAEGGLLVALLLAAVLAGAIRRATHHWWAVGLPLFLVFGGVDYVLRQPLLWAVFLTIWLAAESPPTRTASRP